jgi:ligand-binding sensor domain-containing protein
LGWFRAFIAALVLGGAFPAHALDPGKALSECSVETWRSRDGIVGWIRAITQTPDGYLWVGTNAGVFRYGGGAVLAFQPPPDLARASDVVGLAVVGGTLWITPSRGAPVCVRARADALSECPSDSVRPAPATRLQDRDGNTWTASRKGLLRTGRDGATVTFTRDDGLPEDDVTALFEDREGSLWVGTRGGGLAQFTDRTLDARVGPPRCATAGSPPWPNAPAPCGWARAPGSRAFATAASAP